MGFKDILVHVDSTPASVIRLRLGLALARRFGARLSGLHVVPDPDVPPYFKPSAVARIAETYRENAREADLLAEGSFREATKDIDIITAWQSVEGDIAQLMAERARFADMLLVGQSDTENPPTLSAFSLPEKVVVAAGTPILVVPTRGASDEIGRHVLVAWGGSREAARAVHDAMPLLQTAGAFHSLRSTPIDKVTSTRPQTLPIWQRISRVMASQPCQLAFPRPREAEVLLAHVMNIGADLLVLGAYGHPRLLEFVLGGTTEALLERAAVAILMSH
jgi:nucleotide-binding universal stress UspA family protein